jgi:hypothetical protein
VSGNKADPNSENSNITGDFPSIRKLPLVGVRWANLYRETKIQETVYELLTQQYEMSKIQEAKEIPTVKVLDPPGVPERKSFPPRIVIVLLGTVLSFVFASVFVLGMASWNKSQSQEKQLFTEIWQDIRKELQSDRSVKLKHAARTLWTKSGRNGGSET